MYDCISSCLGEQIATQSPMQRPQEGIYFRNNIRLIWLELLAFKR